MSNQKGEVVMGVMAVIMVVALVFGMVSMHGGHGHGHGHSSKGQQQEHANHDGHRVVK